MADTVTIRAGAADTLVMTMELDLDNWANIHNCMPHHFRSPGESACHTDTTFTRHLLDYAVRLAESPRERGLANLPPFKRADVKVIHDESICERAATVYGGAHDPPHRVVVVRAGAVYFVFDPLEPARAGEFEFTLILDRDLHIIMGLAG